MLLRLRWFSLGAAATVGLVALAARSASVIRDGVTADAALRSGVRLAAGAVDLVAERMAPSDRTAG